MAEQELRTYYNYLYPFDTLVNWLTHNQQSLMAHRELSFEYEGVGVERYVVFADAAAMKNRMISPREKTPLKVDAGAIWNRVPEKESNGKTIEREMIFDFDMNDYDDVRTCCSGKTVCVSCWKLMVIAVEVIEKALAEDFGFHNLMFVFSGGRGLHIWVCDKAARQLTDSVRKAVVDYLQLVTGNDKAASLLADRVISKADDNKYWKGKLVNASREQIKQFYIDNYVSAHVERSLKILKCYFQEVMIQQRFFEHEKCTQIMLKVIVARNKKLKERVENRWAKSKERGAKELFATMVDEICKFEMAVTVEDYEAGRMPDSKTHRLTFIQEEIMLSFLYPRMDYNVSTMQNHLLKLPFSIHPSTKNVSIPLTKRQLEVFDPKTCVKISDLLKNLDYENLSDKNQTNAIHSLLREPIQTLIDFTSACFDKQANDE